MLLTVTTFLPLIGALFLLMIPKEEVGLLKGAAFTIACLTFLVSLGLFMIIINGVTVYLASKLYTPLHITNFWAAVFAGIVIGMVNYLVTTIIADSSSKRNKT